MSEKKPTQQSALVCRQSGIMMNSSREMVTRVREETKRDMEILRQFSLVNGGTKKG